MAHREPRKGDRFEDLMFGEGLGTIIGVTWIDDETFYDVEFDNPKPSIDGRRVDKHQIAAEFFNGPDDNCGTCHFDTERNLYVIKPDDDCLPADDPVVVSLNAAFDQINQEAAKRTEANNAHWNDKQWEDAVER